MIINELIIGKEKLIPVKFRKNGNTFIHNHPMLAPDKKSLIRIFYSFVIRYN